MRFTKNRISLKNPIKFIQIFYEYAPTLHYHTYVKLNKLCWFRCVFSSAVSFQKFHIGSSCGFLRPKELQFIVGFDPFKTRIFKQFAQ